MGLIEMLVKFLVATQLISVWKEGVDVLRERQMAEHLLGKKGGAPQERGDVEAFFTAILTQATDHERVYLICAWWRHEIIPKKVFYRFVGRPYEDSEVLPESSITNQQCLRTIAMAAALQALDKLRDGLWHEQEAHFLAEMAVRADLCLSQRMFRGGRLGAPVTFERYLTNKRVSQWMSMILSSQVMHLGFGCDDPSDPYWRWKVFLAPALSLLRSRSMTDDDILKALERSHDNGVVLDRAQLRDWVRYAPLNLSGERVTEFFKEIR